MREKRLGVRGLLMGIQVYGNAGEIEKDARTPPDVETFYVEVRKVGVPIPWALLLARLLGFLAC